MSTKAEVEVSPQGVPVAAAIPLRGQLKMLADRMMRSHQGYAAFSHLSEVDATGFAHFCREFVSPVKDDTGVRLSLTHFVVKILAKCLRQHPTLNSTLMEDRILLLDNVNIGVAVTLESGMLIVPVIRHVDQKPVVEIAQEANDIAERARNNRLTLDEVKGGTFTLTNVGMFAHKSATGAGLWSTPLITVPQSAILGLGGLYEKPVVRNGEIVAWTMMPTSLTVDHRVVNGIPAIQFMNTFYQLIEEPDGVDGGA